MAAKTIVFKSKDISQLIRDHMIAKYPHLKDTEFAIELSNSGYNIDYFSAYIDLVDEIETARGDKVFHLPNPWQTTC